MRKLILLPVLLACLALGGLSAQSTVPAGAETGEAASSIPDIDFGYVPDRGVFPGIDLFGLLGGAIKPNLMLVEQFFGSASTWFWAEATVVPFTLSEMRWMHSPDGSPVDPLGPDYKRTAWRQFQARMDLLLYQGLVPARANNPFLNPLNLFVGYNGHVALNYRDINPEAYFFASDRADREGFLANVLVAGLKLSDTKRSRLLNTRKGVSGLIQLEWAPTQLGNGLLGKSDFTRVWTQLGFSLPLVEEKDVSLYLFQKTAFDLAWYTAGALPVNLMYTTDLAGSAPVRGAFVPDGHMHASSNLDLRLSFPSLVDTTLMPGLVLFWDCALYDRDDWRFAEDRFISTVGADFVLHLDMAAAFPSTGFMDVQLGLAWDLLRNKAVFHSSLRLPK